MPGSAEAAAETSTAAAKATQREVMERVERIPAVVAFFYTRSFGRALILAWAAGTVAVVAGIGLSFTLDVTTGPVLVVTFGAVLIVALIFRRRFGVTVTDPDDRGLHVRLFEEQPAAAGD